MNVHMTTSRTLRVAAFCWLVCCAVAARAGATDGADAANLIKTRIAAKDCSEAVTELLA